MMDGNSTTLLQDVESFLYTPYGLGALAGAAVLLTSCIWVVCCCFCMCCWRCHANRKNTSETGIIEASNDLKYMTVHSSEFQPPAKYSTGGSSGYHSNVGTLTPLHNHDAMMTHSSMDSILN